MLTSWLYSSHLNFCLRCRSTRNPHVSCIHSGCSFSRRLAKNSIAVSISRCSLIFFSCFIIGLTQAYSEPTNDSLQAYRDEIKQSETNASQAVLDALQANADTDSSSQKKQSTPETSTATSIPRSNNDKAFTPSDNKSANASDSSNKNPWLKPNPWANQAPNTWEKNAKLNPYSNAPIPGPTPPPNTSTNLAIPSPPNIFAPSRPTPNKP
jgi:hypothetical protein